MAGTTNVIQWNPTAANQESDSAYLADSQRAGGATNPSLFDATLANKAFFQWSTYLTALFQAFAAKGFTTSDSNLSTLTAQCANFLTTADALPAVQVVNYSASLAFNAATANGFYVKSMTGNLTISAINNLTSGQIIAFYFQQDSVGGHTVAYPGSVVDAAQIDPTPNSVSIQLFGYDVTTGKLRALGPLISSTGGLGLSNPGTAGQVLTNVNGLFVPKSISGYSYSTPSNSLGTTYTNGSSPKTVIVTGSMFLGVAHTSTLQARVGPSSPSYNVATASIMNSSGYATVTFIVPPGYKYGVYTSIGAPGETDPATLFSWTEY